MQRTKTKMIEGPTNESVDGQTVIERLGESSFSESHHVAYFSGKRKSSGARWDKVNSQVPA
jgi:hypothetical protein